MSASNIADAGYFARALSLGFSMDDPNRPPIMVADGMGVDSTAMLIGLHKAGIRPDAILHADTGGEHPLTEAYIPERQRWLASVGFPELVIVRRKPMKAGKHGVYTTLEGNCLVNETLPSLAFGRKACSQKWKVEPQHRWAQGWAAAALAWGPRPKGKGSRMARKLWRPAQTVVKLIGYDAGPRDSKRSWNLEDDRFYRYVYPLRARGWAREDCVREILAAGVALPPKSACFFCPSSKTFEIARLVRDYPALADRIIAIEAKAAPNMREVEGLWRATVKGIRPGTIARPGNMTVFIEQVRADPALLEFHLATAKRFLPMLEASPCG